MLVTEGRKEWGEQSPGWVGGCGSGLCLVGCVTGVGVTIVRYWCYLLVC